LIQLPEFNTMGTQQAATEQLLEMARTGGVVRLRDVQQRGLHPEYLRRLCAQGLLEHIGRGLYALPQARAEITEHHSLALACKRVPAGVVCLLSALQFHGLTTQAPFEVWLAIDRKAAKPRENAVPLRIVRFGGVALTAGVEEHQVEGVPVKVYSPAKTVADCFKYRHKIGIDVAMEALRDCWRQRRTTMDELWQSARVCRVANVMRPYLEFLT
jgi:predicted transcriptional regulator of viral defense system